MGILNKVSEIASVVGFQLSFFDGAGGEDAGRNVSLLFWFLQRKGEFGMTDQMRDVHLAQEDQQDGQQEEDDGAEDGEDDGEVW